MLKLVKPVRIQLARDFKTKDLRAWDPKQIQRHVSKNPHASPDSMVV